VKGDCKTLCKDVEWLFLIVDLRGCMSGSDLRWGIFSAAMLALIGWTTWQLYFG